MSSMWEDCTSKAGLFWADKIIFYSCSASKFFKYLFCLAALLFCYFTFQLIYWFWEHSILDLISPDSAN